MSTEKLVAFIGKRVALLSDMEAKVEGGKVNVVTRSRHLEAVLIFREAQAILKAERAKARKRKSAEIRTV